jgi:hypothetical protein
VDQGIGTISDGASMSTGPLLAARTYTLTVANAAGSLATATLTVGVQTVVVSAITPGSSNRTIYSTVGFRASVTGALNATLVWTATGGTIDPATGAWKAPASPGVHTITATSVADPSKSSSVTITVLAKSLDLNGDGVVDLRDLLLLAGEYGSAGTVADLDLDGIVDEVDLAILMEVLK